ncbi:MAG: GAF domain-containing protein [Deltaproteobacteria bacterium]|nr:GAF domain-containing protein [Deltaproteobacteria bacterium]
MPGEQRVASSWRIEVSKNGSSPDARREAVIDADNWMGALRAGRQALGMGSEPLPGSELTCEFREDGSVQVSHAKEQMTYVVGPAATKSFNKPAPRGPQIPADAVPPNKTSPGYVKAADIPRPRVGGGKSTQTAAVVPSPSAVSRPTASTAPAKRESAPPAAAAAGPPEGLTRFGIRIQEPAADNKLLVHEATYAVPEGTTIDEAERLLRVELERVKAELAARPQGKLIALAAFDHTWAGKPKRGPLVALTLRDWRETEPEVKRGKPRRASRPPSAPSQPPPAPSLPSAAPSQPPPTPQAAPSHPPPAPQAAPSHPPPAPQAAPSHPPPAPQAAPSHPPLAPQAAMPPAPQAVTTSPSAHPIPAPQVASPPPAQLVASASQPLAPIPSSPLPEPAVVSAPAPIAIGGPAPTAAPAPTATAVEAEPVATPAAPVVPVVPTPAAPTPAPRVSDWAAPAPSAASQASPTEEPAPASVPDAAQAAEPSPPPAADPGAAVGAPAASPGITSPVAVPTLEVVETPPIPLVSPVAAAVPAVSQAMEPAPAVAAPTPVPPPPPPTPSGAQAHRASRPPSERRSSIPPRPRRSTGEADEERLADVFERVQDLFFLQTALEGCEFVLHLCREMIPCEAGSALLYDINADELRFVFVEGPVAEQLKGQAVSRRRGLLGVAAQVGYAVVVSDVATDPRFDRSVDERTGFVSRSLLTCRVQMDGQLLGALQLVNSTSSRGFTGTDAHLVEYIAEQFADFLIQARLRSASAEQKLRKR